ncbi:MAG: SdiA-regulated domain-containing protein [Ignavibacteriae bacterium]|nr:SdiA-regulated domain-containing protein [Ignavibacteriota bacterium]
MRKLFKIFSIILLITISNFCNSNNNVNGISGNIKPVSQIKINVPEPSGLYFDEITNSLWTVSDESSKIYQINFDGEVLNSFSLNGFDLEGITFLNDTTIVTILERTREVVFLHINGKEIKRFSLNIYGKPNSGFEGIEYNSINNHLYIVNEKSPCLLIETDLDGNIISQNKIDFAKDLSGLCYDKTKNELWIISDESKAVFKCSTEGKLIQKYDVGIKQIEGIAINFSQNKLYIISDPEETLYIFNLP